MDYVVTNFGWKVNFNMLYMLRDFYPPKSWTSWVLLALSCVGYGILYIDFSAKYCTCVEQPCHIPRASSATDDTSPCTGLSVSSGLSFSLPPIPLPSLAVPTWASAYPLRSHIPWFFLSWWSEFRFLRKQGWGVDLCVTRDYNPRKQEWKIREVRTRRKSQDKGVAQKRLLWNINDCLVFRAVPWAAVWTASQNSPLEDGKDAVGAPPDALYRAC